MVIYKPTCATYVLILKRILNCHKTDGSTGILHLIPNKTHFISPKHLLDNKNCEYWYLSSIFTMKKNLQKSNSSNMKKKKTHGCW